MKEEEYPFNKELEEVEQIASIEDDQNELPPSDIVAYNELRSCADLKRMHESNQLKIDPDFQREFVWKKTDQTRFIDSLVKQLPIPSMCISYDFQTDERLVIDGLQRINTIIKFLIDDEYALSRLDDIDPKLSGKTVFEIRTKASGLYSRVENLTIPITVIRCDTSKHSHMDYLFTIFHRLNSGGSRLNNQEIRNCIYNGKFNTFLKETVKNPTYLKLMGISDPHGYRFAYEEQNLRFFAFYDRWRDYRGKFAKFLSDYMFDKSKNKISDEEIEQKRQLFHSTVNLAFEKVTGKKSLKGVSKAVIDALLVGLANNLDFVQQATDVTAMELFHKLRADELFSVSALKENIAQKSRVYDRLERAIQIFSGD